MSKGLRGYVTEVVAANYLAQPEADRAGRPYPRHYAYVKLPWLASAANPNPVSPHPVPVFLNHFHGPRQDWVPLRVGTRVVVIPVDVSRLNPLGLAVIAYGPQNTDDQFADLRETAEYRAFPGNAGKDLLVDADEDPVFGPNADVGRTHLDGRGYGWQTRHPWPDDANRDVMTTTGPGTTITSEKRLDAAVERHQVTYAGTAVTYTFDLDAVAQTATLADDKGNSFVIDTANNDITTSAERDVLLTAKRAVGFDALQHGFYATAPIPKPTVSGSTVAVNGAPVTALDSLIAALAALGLVTDAT